MQDEQRRLILAFIAGSACTTIMTAAFILPMEKKFVNRIKSVVLSQRHIIQWVAKHALDLDREEFTQQFLEQVAFYNIVVEES